MTDVAADWRALAESIRPCIPVLRQYVAAAVGSQTRLVEAAVADPSPQIVVVVATANEEPEGERRRERRRW